MSQKKVGVEQKKKKEKRMGNGGEGGEIIKERVREGGWGREIQKYNPKKNPPLLLHPLILNVVILGYRRVRVFNWGLEWRAN